MESPTPARLSTTSYAILGLLAIRPWSTYELAQLMKLSLRFFWPRAASGLYEEPKKLVVAGLATVRPVAVGRRRRTEYAITDAGRVALVAWVGSTPVGRSTFESDALVRFFFGDVGTKDGLLAAIGAIRSSAEAELRQWALAAGPYATGHGRFPQRIHVNALTLELMWRMALTQLAWADGAEREVLSWPDERGPADRTPFERRIRDLLAAAPRGLLDAPDA